MSSSVAKCSLSVTAHQQCRENCCGQIDLCKVCHRYSITKAGPEDSEGYFLGAIFLGKKHRKAKYMRVLGVELDQWGDAPIQMDEEKLDKPVGGVWHKTRILVKQNVKRKNDPVAIGTVVGTAQINCPRKINSDKAAIFRRLLKLQNELPVSEASKKPAKKTTSQKKKNIDHPQKQNIPVVSIPDNEHTESSSKTYNVIVLDSFKDPKSYLTFFLGACKGVALPWNNNASHFQARIIAHPKLKIKQQCYVKQDKKSMLCHVLFHTPYRLNLDIRAYLTEIIKLQLTDQHGNVSNTLHQVYVDYMNKSLFHWPSDAAALYCDQPLVKQHSTCGICSASHMQLHWSAISGSSDTGEIQVADPTYRNYLSQECSCQMYSANLTGPVTMTVEKKGMVFKLLTLATIPNLPSGTHTVRIKGKLFEQLEILTTGCRVTWDQGMPYIALKVISLSEQAFWENNQPIALCQIRCMTDQMCENLDLQEALLVHHQLFPLGDNPSCSFTCPSHHVENPDLI